MYTAGNDSREFFFADHGLCVLLRKEIAAYFEIMRNTKSNHVLWLKDSILNKCNFILGAVYLPCES